MAKPAGGVQLIVKRPTGLIAPPVPESAGIMAFTLPDDDITRRSAAKLAPLLGNIVLNLLQPASAAQPYMPPPITSTTAAASSTLARDAAPSPTPSLDQPRLVMATSASTGTTTTQPSSTPSRPSTSVASVVPVTTSTTIPLAPTPTTATVAQTSASAGTSMRNKSASK